MFLLMLARIMSWYLSIFTCCNHRGCAFITCSWFIVVNFVVLGDALFWYSLLFRVPNASVCLDFVCDYIFSLMTTINLMSLLFIVILFSAYLFLLSSCTTHLSKRIKNITNTSNLWNNFIENNRINYATFPHQNTNNT